jgi:hypothetical protein
VHSRNFRSLKYFYYCGKLSSVCAGGRPLTAVSIASMSQAIYTFRVSDRVFRLTADAIRVYSLKTGQFETVSSTAIHGLGIIGEMLDFRQIWRSASERDETGDYRITLRINLRDKPAFQAAREAIAKATGTVPPVRFVFVSALLAVFEGTDS